jgi:hypothetical protein
MFDRVLSAGNKHSHLTLAGKGADCPVHRFAGMIGIAAGRSCRRVRAMGTLKRQSNQGQPRTAAHKVPKAHT